MTQLDEKHVNDFLQFLQVEKGCSPNTIAAYRNDIYSFLAFKKEAAKLPAETAASHKRRERPDNTLLVHAFVAHLQAKGYSHATIARRIAALKSYDSFLVAEGLIPAGNTIATFPVVRVPKELPKAMSPEQVDELLEQPLRRDTPEAKRDKAMLELLYATGIRVSELVSLDIDSISLAADHAYVRCMGKGSKERTIPIHEHAAEAIQTYVSEARSRLVGAGPETALFVNRRGERLTRQGLWLILTTYARAANIGTRVTPHTLRHSFALHKLKGGTPLRNVQELLGHANISTTQVYERVIGESMRSVYKRSHPRANIAS